MLTLKATALSVAALTFFIAGSLTIPLQASAATSDPTHVKNSNKSLNTLRIVTQEGRQFDLKPGIYFNSYTFGIPNDRVVGFVVPAGRDAVVCRYDDKNNNCVGQVQRANATGYHNIVNYDSLTIHLIRD